MEEYVPIEDNKHMTVEELKKEVQKLRAENKKLKQENNRLQYANEVYCRFIGAK